VSSSSGAATGEAVHFGLTPWRTTRETGSALESFVAQVELAENLGFHSFWLPESHFTQPAAYPAPLLLLAAAAVRTQHLRLGTTSYLLPIRNPLHVAEEVGVLDQLSGGRVILGVGRGFRPSLFEAFQVPRSEKRDRFEASLAAILRAWRGESVLDESEAENVRAQAPLRLSPTPRQLPHPPIWVAAFGPKALTQAGNLNLPYLASPLETLQRLVENYALHEAARPEDARNGQLPVPVIRTAFVTREAARARAIRDALTKQLRALAQTEQALPRPAHDAPIDAWALVGEPERVAEGIERYREALGLTHLILRAQVPEASASELAESVHLLAELHGRFRG